MTMVLLGKSNREEGGGGVKIKFIGEVASIQMCPKKLARKGYCLPLVLVH